MAESFDLDALLDSFPIPWRVDERICAVVDAHGNVVDCDHEDWPSLPLLRLLAAAPGMVRAIQGALADGAVKTHYTALASLRESLP